MPKGRGFLGCSQRTRHATPKGERCDRLTRALVAWLSPPIHRRRFPQALRYVDSLAHGEPERPSSPALKGGVFWRRKITAWRWWRRKAGRLSGCQWYRHCARSRTSGHSYPRCPAGRRVDVYLSSRKSPEPRESCKAARGLLCRHGLSGTPSSERERLWRQRSPPEGLGIYRRSGHPSDRGRAEGSGDALWIPLSRSVTRIARVTHRRWQSCRQRARESGGRSGRHYLFVLRTSVRAMSFIQAAAGEAKDREHCERIDGPCIGRDWGGGRARNSLNSTALSGTTLASSLLTSTPSPPKIPTTRRSM